MKQKPFWKGKDIFGEIKGKNESATSKKKNKQLRKI